MWRRAGLASLAILLLPAACSSGDDDGGGGLAGDGDGVAATLASLPLPSSVDEDAALTVAYGDLARAAQLAGIELPESPEAAELDEQLAVLNTITGVLVSDDGERTPVAVVPPEAAHVEQLVDVEAFVDDVGWSVFDVRRFVELQAQPDNLTVMEGEFDESRLTEALGEPEDGVWIAGNPDGMDIDDITPARPVGEPLWLTLDDERLVVARSADQMEAVRDGGTGTPTLADDDVMVALAEAVDAADAYSALLYRGTLSFDFASVVETPEQAEELCAAALQEPFAGVATAITDDDGPVFVLAYVHADADAAEANAETLEGLVDEGTSLRTRGPWSDQFEVDDIATDGPVLTARLRPTDATPAAIWQQLVLQRENLVTYC